MKSGVNNLMNVLTADEVLKDIEFELLQGTVARNELGQGIQATRRFQNQVRSASLQAAAADQLEVSDLVGRQFQINDMVLSLFQVTDGRLSSLQSEMHSVAYFKTHAVQGRRDEELSDSLDVHAAIESSQQYEWTADNYSMDDDMDSDLVYAMQLDALAVPIDVRPVHMPLIGGFLTRLRTSLHNLVHFYVERLAKKQTEVNQLYGEHIERLEQVNRQQQNQIESLNRQVASLRARVDS